MCCVLAETFEFSQEGRKVFIFADRIAVDNNGITDGTVRQDAINRMTEIERFIIFECQVGARVLAVKIQKGSGMLKFLTAMCLFLKPWPHGTENSRENTAPAEPEKEHDSAVVSGHCIWKSALTQNHADCLRKAFG